MRALLLFGFLLSGGVDGPVVYYGDLEGAKKPCQVKARKVFSQISDYKKIKEMEVYIKNLESRIRNLTGNSNNILNEMEILNNLYGL